MEVLIINGIDYSHHIERKGFGWSRNDIDSEKTTRLKNGKLRRKKITDKRKLVYKFINMSRAEIARLNNDLKKETFTATYLDVDGMVTKEFYTSSLTATLVSVVDDVETWETGDVTMTEV